MSQRVYRRAWSARARSRPWPEGLAGTTEQVALASGDRPRRGRLVHVTDELEDLRALDPLGDDERLRLASEADHRGEHRLGGRVLQRAGDHAVVDLEVVDPQVAQNLEARVAGSHVVERDAKAERTEPSRLAHDKRQRRGEALRYLQHDPLRGQPGIHHGADERVILERAVPQGSGARC